ncbi:MAG: hypothetical protein BGO55_20690 [Sphingobacteriales bacterium 50-39]|nr:hypothetical protein [Sphingobacteriales bacterium]OJW59107.1 MAG: hypothetical protein BGO55_20690 [Sphingobacteriales bacterium 50-39]
MKPKHLHSLYLFGVLFTTLLAYAIPSWSDQTKVELLFHLQQPELLNTRIVCTIWPTLPEKEKEFIRLCCTEATYKEIGSAQEMGVGSVEIQREKVFLKFEVKNRIALVIHVIKNNLA